MELFWYFTRRERVSHIVSLLQAASQSCWRITLISGRFSLWFPTTILNVPSCHSHSIQVNAAIIMSKFYSSGKALFQLNMNHNLTNRPHIARYSSVDLLLYCSTCAHISHKSAAIWYHRPNARASKQHFGNSNSAAIPKNVFQCWRLLKMLSR